MGLYPNLYCISYRGFVVAYWGQEGVCIAGFKFVFSSLLLYFALSWTVTVVLERICLLLLMCPDL